MRILIPVDGSAGSLNAIRFIGSRAAFMKDKPGVTLLNVQHNIPGLVIERFGLAAVRSVYEAEGSATLEKAEPALEEAGLEADTRVILGECGPAIARAAEEEKSDFIAMGSRGLSPAKSFFLGSVSRSVLEHSLTPVLLVSGKPAPAAENLRVLLAVDGSDYGEAAAAFIAEHPELFGPKPAIDVLFVVPDYRQMACAQVDSINPGEAIKQFEIEGDRAWKRAVEPVVATLAEAGFEARAVRRTGEAAEEISAYAKENADIIVMGSHGWGKFKAAVLGSTAARVGADTDLPMLIIRAPSDELLV